MTTNGNNVSDTELERLGIKRFQTEGYAFGEYRYSNARDAIAAATRGQKQ